MKSLEVIEYEYLKDWNKDLALTEDEEDGIRCHEMAIQALEHEEEYRRLKELNTPKKPIYKLYEDPGNPPYTKIVCPSCGIQLSPVTDRNNAHENVFCNKCSQKIDWSEVE